MGQQPSILQCLLDVFGVFPSSNALEDGGRFGLRERPDEVERPLEGVAAVEESPTFVLELLDSSPGSLGGSLAGLVTVFAFEFMRRAARASRPLSVALGHG